MAQQSINYGVTPEDHLGEGLFYIFKKTQENFTEVYAKTNLLNFDVNGSLVANISMRSGAYASLITLAGSVGEIGVATDVEAFIRYNGVAGQAVIFRKSREIGYAFGAIYTNGVVTATDTAALITASYDALAMVNVTTSEISIPSGTGMVDFSFSVQWGDAGSPAGTLRRVAIEGWVSNAWIESFGVTINSTGDATYPVRQSASADATVDLSTKYRIRLYHTRGANLSPTGFYTVKFLQL